MHTDVSSPQAHGAPGFLPWHRAYLLDLERELQAIDPSVALPYWRFDQPAPKLFTPDFFGDVDRHGTVQFGATNPLQFWVTDGVQGDHAPTAVQQLESGDQPGRRHHGSADAGPRDGLSGLPHDGRQPARNGAHEFGRARSRSIGTAAKDPLFFLLHCNVDRLWAKWQRQNGRFDPAQAASYDSNPGNPVGHNLPDTMWPWNGVTGRRVRRPPRRRDGRVAVRERAGTAAARAEQPRLPGRRQRALA